jgi:acyl dehydratase
MLTINSYEEFASYEGKELGVSDWLTITQEKINLFADATDDHQWIHVDEERCKTESPFGQTIAHGYLTMSTIPCMWSQILEVNNLERMMNYGIEKMRFIQPVLSGQNIRMRVSLEEIQNLRGAVKTNVRFIVEIKETGKKAVEGLATFVYYFKK